MKFYLLSHIACICTNSLLSRKTISYRFFKGVISFTFALYLENLTDKILSMRTYIGKLTRFLQKSAIIFFFIKLISIYQNPLVHVVLHNHTEWLTTLGNTCTYTVGLTCIFWTISNYMHFTFVLVQLC